MDDARSARYLDEALEKAAQRVCDVFWRCLEEVDLRVSDREEIKATARARIKDILRERHQDLAAVEARAAADVSAALTTTASDDGRLRAAVELALADGLLTFQAALEGPPQ